MSDIKIMVACHKPSVLPRNNLFVPVQVGASKAAKRMDNMCHDDEGENISAKNPFYCELTAQYWGWKNLEADYYGLCHYRRFICFHDNDVPRNLRDQIEATAIDSFNLKRFGLEDEAEMRAIIEANDIVCGPLQKVSRLYTPRGNQPTAMRHWTAHDRALIMSSDLEKMLSILQEVAPGIGIAARKYLSGKYFLGFNCFVMKKELFQEMCRIEFEVLERLEKAVDLSTYNQQISRIYGFMAEIICSSYIDYIEKSGKYSVKHLPLVYFNYTDDVPDYEPIKGEKIIPVYFSHDETMPFLFGPQLRSFLDHIDPVYQYDVIAGFSGVTPQEKKKFTDMCATYDNVSLRFLDADLWKQMLAEKEYIYEKTQTVIPWILEKYRRILVFSDTILFQNSIVPMWESCKDAEEAVCAAPDVLVRSRVNDIYYETEERYLSKQMKNPLAFFFAGAMAWNLEKVRRTKELKMVTSLTRNELGENRTFGEIINIVCEGDCKALGAEYDVWYMSNPYLKYQLPYAPCADYLAMLKAQKNPVIVAYEFDMLWFETGSEVADLFWEAAKRTLFYEQCIAHMIHRTSSLKNEDEDLLNRLFPKGNRMRGILSRLFPKGSGRYRFVKRVLHLFHKK